MPTFLDHHDTFETSPEKEAAIAEQIRSGRPTEDGVRGINMFLTADGGAYCLMEGPDAAAVVRAHEGGGQAIRLEDVVEVRALV